MQHLAIMDPKKKFLEKILTEEKTIESRWSIQKRNPFNNIKKGDQIYFKNSGKEVSVIALVNRVLFFEDLNPKKVKEILDEYGERIGITKTNKKEFYDYAKNKKYCTIIFLEKIKTIKLFQINKRGYGNMSAWITLKNINSIKIRIDKK